MHPQQSQAPHPSRPFPLAAPSARRATRNDLNRALRVLRRAPGARAFLLTPPPASLDLSLLAAGVSASRPHFTIATEEVQRGTLAGRIALRYLGLPAFSDSDGLSGGLVVTTYASRTHPLHAPAVMAHVRVGRYVRDNATGDWCILTRNRRDRLTRLQYITTSDAGARERICLTCSSDLFDRGRMLDSVLFNCHDNELRVCTRCAAAPHCACVCAARDTAARAPPLGLAALADNVVREGAAEWLGTVRVTVVSNLSNNPVLNLDETMTVRSSYTPTIDAVLASEMQRLAIIETATQATTVPYAVPHASSPHLGAAAGASRAGSAGSDACDACMLDVSASDRSNTSSFNHAASTAAAFEMSRIGAAAADPTFDDVFTMEDTTEVANHFLIMQESAISEALSESPMLPADPSTLPGGIDCLEGMELEAEDYSYFAPASAPTAPRSELLNEEVVANALAGSDMDDLFMPHDTDNVDKLGANVERCAPASASRDSGTPAPSQQAGKLSTSAGDNLSAAEGDDRGGKRLKRGGATDTAETMTSLTLESSGSASSKSAATSHASATDRTSLAELSPLPSGAQSPVDGSKRADVPQAAPAAGNDAPVTKARQPHAEAKQVASVPTSEACVLGSAPSTPAAAPQIAQRSSPGSSHTGSPHVVPQAVPVAAPPQAPPIAMPVASLMPFAVAPVSGIQNATAAPMTGPGLFPGAAMLGHAGPWFMAPADAATMSACTRAAPAPAPAPAPMGNGAAAATVPTGAAPRLAPRPKGMPCNDGIIWQMGSVPVAANPALAYAMPAQMAHWQQMERKRKAEERRKKNRQAAARSNARKKDLMDGYRAEIAAEKDKVSGLLAREAELRRENAELKRRLGQV